MKKENGFTLIELLAVIIILAVIALIATPIVLNVVEKAKESSRQSSVAGYADAAKLYVYDEQFKTNGQVPSNEDIKKNTTNQGDTVVCEEVIYSSQYGIVLHECRVSDNETLYYFASGKTYTDATNTDYKTIYDSVKGSTTPTIPVSGVSDNCAKAGSTCTIDQIKTGVSMNVQVNNTDTHKFYILSDDGTNVTLIMDRNLDIDKNGTPNDLVAWMSKADYIAAGGTEADYGSYGNNNKGPITVLTALENYTNNWTNIASINYNLTGTNTNDYNGCSDYNVCTSNKYTISERTNVKVRLPRNQEMAAIGCTRSSNSCPTWAYDYLDGRPNPISGTYGYWTSSASATYSYYAWNVDIYGDLSNDYVFNNFYGVRPVITISKSNIK